MTTFAFFTGRNFWARLVDDHFVLRKSCASDRRSREKIVQWFWKNFKRDIGPTHKVLIINDPYEEVHYCQGFSCADPLNKYLVPEH